MKSFAGWAISPRFQRTARAHNAFAFITEKMKGLKGYSLIAAAFLVAGSTDASQPAFRFERDTFTFANMTVFEYRDGVAHLRRGEEAKRQRYTRRCFVLSRAAIQFHKFAHFDPQTPAPDERELARRIRQVTRRPVWKPEPPENERVVIPGYADLRALSKARGRILQDNVGKGWPVYWRMSNSRAFWQPGVGYQKRTRQILNQTLARGDLFVGYLTTLPSLRINHAVLVYKKKPGSKPNVDRYLVYDPNHPEGPRELAWSEQDQSFSFQKDWDFVGGKVRVYQIYGKPFQ
jgi:hypothetical protein